MRYFTICESPLGHITLYSNGTDLTGLGFERQKYPPYTQGGNCENLKRDDDLKIFDDTKKWLLEYFAGKQPSAKAIPLAPEGSPFRREIWRLLCEIPYGEVTTYGKLAAQAAANLGKDRMSAQAVGGAVGHNPISIIIPCHRVVGANGSLTGYGGGMEKKIWLLTHEGIDMKRFTIPTRGTAI